MKGYDTVFITHLPSFYKTNLYNQIAKRQKIYVIFVASGSIIRNSDFVGCDDEFDSITLNEGAFEKRNKIKSFFKVIGVLQSLKYKKVIVGGWDLIEFWAPLLINKKSKNMVAVESTIHEYKSSWLKDFMKKFFISRVSCTFCSGKPHVELIRHLGFTGDVKVTKGVGLINHNRPESIQRNFNDGFSGSFVYVGRLSPEKGLVFLLDFFKNHPEYNITICGDGPLYDYINKNKTENVILKGYLDNKEVISEIQKADVFILPSYSEPWGLVVEESIAAGVPVICSTAVGCSSDLVEDMSFGATFSAGDEESLIIAVMYVKDNYVFLRDNIQNSNIYEVNCQHQVSMYD
ncbi:glycosyltransferase [Kluyvera ascorbata]|uniref:glycosyltransferase n=1 Tax=Kluyvera ascorbata TaxID=51288 RepID=UPI0039F46BE3